MISIGIIGGTGYTGKWLVDFCSNHPFIEEINVYVKESAGKFLLDIFPELNNEVENAQIKSISELSFDQDVYFIALPHGESLKYVPTLYNAGKIIIDLGGDYRLNNSVEYEQWYNYKHTSPELLNEKIYGLADYFQAYDQDKRIIANPGCYPTAILLAALPIVENFSENIQTISVSAYSGTSGAGKSVKQELMMSEMFGNVRAYKLNKHQHQPEILQQLRSAGLNSPFSFATHLLPVSTGIYATSFIHLINNVSEGEIKEIYKAQYENSMFVRLRKDPPKLNHVANTNYCDINISVKDKVVIITSAIDNLVKGAAGQAVQNLNKYYGWDETMSIKKYGVGVV
jgi:N-acetyl-gamma-glutamyl-phosphate reductase